MNNDIEQKSNVLILRAPYPTKSMTNKKGGSTLQVLYLLARGMESTMPSEIGTLKVG